MREHKVAVTRTAHYYTLGDPGDHIKYFWFSCHGYGQAADRHILKFESIKQDDTFVVAPEGLSRFYWQDFKDPVSSWMTRKDRLDEIKDYSNYLAKVFFYYKEQLPQDVIVILMGFSQGVATQFRWIMREFPGFDYLILWGGLIPEDLDYTPHREYFADKSLHFVYGDQDQYLTPKTHEMHDALINRFQFEINRLEFKGKHKVDKKVLKKVDALIRG